jgi:hypothetical protein
MTAWAGIDGDGRTLLWRQNGNATGASCEIWRLARDGTTTRVAIVSADRSCGFGEMGVGNFALEAVFDLRCAAARCVLVERSQGWMRFSDFDWRAGTIGEPFHQEPMPSQVGPWDLAQDGETIAFLRYGTAELLLIPVAQPDWPTIVALSSGGEMQFVASTAAVELF